jgi:polyhydroxyalkanoate synthesis regulator protein
VIKDFWKTFNIKNTSVQVQEATTENLWNIFANIESMIKYSDAKASLLLTAQVALLTIIFESNADGVYKYFSENCFTKLMILSTAVTVIMSITYSFSVIYPRLTEMKPNSIIYFGSIQAFKDSRSYFEEFKNTFSDIEKFNEDISMQIYIISDIASKKFQLFRKSMKWFFISLILFLINIISYYFLLDFLRNQHFFNQI